MHIEICAQLWLRSFARFIDISFGRYKNPSDIIPNAIVYI